MRPYSQDLRDRVLAAVRAGQQSQADVAKTFGISPSTVEKWWRRWRETRQRAPRPRRHGPWRRLAACENLIRAEVRKQPDVTLAELCARVSERQGVSASPSMMCRTLHVLGLPRKKSRSTRVSGRPRA